ncbi:CBM96 family carbohydrate-binding protein [Lentzea aerocolonigenes]|uniref:CBM96 family carbohydrate-binding protein n=1 Tax=Lentzea aerocolonigenes TaxID=68170 RepID=UPI000751670F|nr:hypothetical protein [Lentzea aerocolonigenes]MCP2245446.1 hypothetical protein [Lentzea aerocolonigenes]
MRSSGRPWRGAGALVAALVAGLVVVVPGTAHAAQQPNWATLSPARWVTTDSKQPHKSITTGDARVGAWRDDRHHIGKSYFTFDLSRFKGTQLFTASLRTPEKAANDCTKPRSTQLWVVKPQERITWANQPWEITNIAPTANQDCVSPWVTWNVAEPIKKALERGRTEITFALRIAEPVQGQVSYGRTYDPAAVLSTTFNTPPGVPTDLQVGNGTCDPATNFYSDAQPAVSAIAHDADGTYGLEGRLAFWPVAAPEQRVESGLVWAGSGYLNGWFPAGMVKDGGVYAFAARTEDGFATSEWSAPCQFTADFTPPATAPAISSTTYRENGGPPGDGGEGVPGDFTFDAKGDKDVVAFEYSGVGVGGGRVNADAPGGKATVSITPTSDGPLSVSVTGIDRAGHRSPTTSYRFWVRTTAPFVQVPLFEIGVPRDFVFTANQDGATQFVYQLDGGAEQTVPVAEDRTGRKTVTFTEPGAERREIKVWTVNAAGTRSGVSERSFSVNQLRPEVDVDPWDGTVGQTRTVTVTTRRTGVVSYVYKVGDEPEKQLPANANGSLTFEYTPTAKGDFAMLVASLNAAGVRSGWGTGEFLAEAPAPDVTSNDYRYEPGGAPGQTGTFTFSSPRLPVVSYKYKFDDEPWQSTTGTQVQWAPKKPGYHYLTVIGVTAGGVESDERSYAFQVKAALPVVTSPQYPDGGPVTARPGEPIEFVVTPALAGSREVLWNIAFNQPQVVPVGEDGKARFTVTLSSSGTFSLTVSSRTSDGVVSGNLERSYFVPQQ